MAPQQQPRPGRSATEDPWAHTAQTYIVN